MGAKKKRTRLNGNGKHHPLGKDHPLTKKTKVKVTLEQEADVASDEDAKKLFETLTGRKILATKKKGD